jgi:arylformamidase
MKKSCRLEAILIVYLEERYQFPSLESFMKAVDLTHPIRPGMPVFPGTEPPEFEQTSTIAGEGFAELKVHMYTHTGTHMDAPAHMLEGAFTLDDFTPDHFAGKAVVIDVIEEGASPIALEAVLPYAEQIQQVDFVLLKTGWSRYWGDQRYFEGFPSLSLAAANWLAEQGLKGVGVDALSMDGMDSQNYEVHKVLLSRNILLIENLTNLDALSTEAFLLCVLPLKIEGADGAPVRAVAIEGVL